jgi:hypothetical protein
MTKTNRKTWVGHVAYKVEILTQDFDGKSGRIDTTWKTQVLMG